MRALLRLFAWSLTAFGFLALGADLLAMLESGARTPYTLGRAQAAAHGLGWAPAPSCGGDLADLVCTVPVSLASLWAGAILFVAAGRRRRRTALESGASPLSDRHGGVAPADLPAAIESHGIPRS
jgi:hypothetical protein